MTLDRPSRVLVVIAPIAFLVLLSVWCLRWGLADALAYGATREINTWTATGVSPGIDTWMWVRSDLERAQRLSPSDPAVPELLGVLHLQRAGRAEFSELALEHFAKALALRPSSPYTWANIAEARYRLGMTQPPFEELLVQAHRQGPSEPETQRLLAELGLAMWDEIQPRTRQAVEQAIAAGMRRNPLETLRISERRGRLRLACSLVPGDKRLADTKWTQACKR